MPNATCSDIVWEQDSDTQALQWRIHDLFLKSIFLVFNSFTLSTITLCCVAMVLKNNNNMARIARASGHHVIYFVGYDRWLNFVLRGCMKW